MYKTERTPLIGKICMLNEGRFPEKCEIRKYR
jgi:hypothetical protein